MQTGYDPLVFRCSLTEDDYVNKSRLVSNLVIRPAIRWLALGFWTFVATICLMSIAVAEHMPLEALLILLGFPITWPLAVVALMLHPGWLARRYYRRNREHCLETKITITKDLVLIENIDHRIESRWNLCGAVIDHPTGLLFCSHRRQPLFWLPARLFEGNDLRDRALSLAAQNSVTVRHRA